MDLGKVVDLCRAFDAEGLPYWVDGGWGVDTLLGKQTRQHSDLDLAVAYTALPAFARLLALQAFSRHDRTGDPEWNWVFRHVKGQSVDLHGFWWDEQGNAVLGEAADKSMYPKGALSGRGMIGALDVNCVSAEAVLNFRAGFEPRPKDRHDVAMLCDTFGLQAPTGF